MWILSPDPLPLKPKTFIYTAASVLTLQKVMAGNEVDKETQNTPSWEIPAKPYHLHYLCWHSTDLYAPYTQNDELI